jgi:hypothetical protein
MLMLRSQVQILRNTITTDCPLPSGNDYEEPVRFAEKLWLKVLFADLL